MISVPGNHGSMLADLNVAIQGAELSRCIHERARELFLRFMRGFRGRGYPSKRDGAPLFVLPQEFMGGGTSNLHEGVSDLQKKWLGVLARS